MIVVPPPPEDFQPLGELLLRHAGKANGLPVDMAAQHDRYLHGTPKRRPDVHFCGELTCQKCGLTLSTNDEVDYDELGQRAKGLGWVVEYSAGPEMFRILCPDCQH